MNFQQAGAGLQIGGTLLNGFGAAAGANTQADAARYNAGVADNLARQARDAGTQSELAVRRRSAQQLGALRAAVAESGFNPSSGSALDIQTQGAGNAEMDALQQRYVGLLRGNAYDSQAQMARYAAQGYESQGNASIGSSLISTASQVLKMGQSFGGGSPAGSAAGGAGAGGGITSVASGVSARSGGSAMGSLDGLSGTFGSIAGGGSSAGGSAAGSSLGGAGGGAAGFWPYWVAAAVVLNESYAKSHGERRSGSGYYKDLATGRVLSQDVDNRWSPMFFGKSDSMGFGHDMSFAADVGSFQFGKAFKDFRSGTLGKIFDIF